MISQPCWGISDTFLTTTLPNWKKSILSGYHRMNKQPTSQDIYSWMCSSARKYTAAEMRAQQGQCMVSSPATDAKWPIWEFHVFSSCVWFTFTAAFLLCPWLEGWRCSISSFRSWMTVSLYHSVLCYFLTSLPRVLSLRENHKIKNKTPNLCTLSITIYCSTCTDTRTQTQSVKEIHFNTIQCKNKNVFKYVILAAIIEVSLLVLSLLHSINQKVLKAQLVLINLLLHFKAHDVSLYSGNMLVHRNGKQSSSHWHQLHLSTSSASLLLEDKLSEALKHFHNSCKWGRCPIVTYSHQQKSC